MRPGVGIPLIFPGVGIADCRGFPGVVDMVNGCSTVNVRRTVDFLHSPISHHMTRALCHNRVLLDRANHKSTLQALLQLQYYSPCSSSDSPPGPAVQSDTSNFSFRMVATGRKETLSPEHANQVNSPPASTSYPACVKLRKSSALAPTFVFLPKIHPSSLALKTG